MFEVSKERDCFSLVSQRNVLGGRLYGKVYFLEKFFLERFIKGGFFIVDFRGGGFLGLGYYGEFIYRVGVVREQKDKFVYLIDF